MTERLLILVLAVLDLVLIWRWAKGKPHRWGQAVPVIIGLVAYFVAYLVVILHISGYYEVSIEWLNALMRMADLYVLLVIAGILINER